MGVAGGGSLFHLSEKNQLFSGNLEMDLSYSECLLESKVQQQYGIYKNKKLQKKSGNYALTS